MSEVWFTVQQPILFPPVYMMERFARCHHVVVFDEAQFDRDNIQFQLMTLQGPKMQSISLVDANYQMSFADRVIAHPDIWARKLLTTAQTVYGRQEHYKHLKGWFTAVVSRLVAEHRLHLFCVLATQALFDLLGMPTELHLGSAYGLPKAEEPTEWVAAFGDPIGVTDYVQGGKSMHSYFVKGPFERRRVTTWAQLFETEYPSTAGRLGTAGLSILDLLFTCGVAEARRLLLLDCGPGNHGTVELVTR
jgi:hypothetical protein